VSQTGGNSIVLRTACVSSSPSTDCLGLQSPRFSFPFTLCRTGPFLHHRKSLPYAGRVLDAVRVGLSVFKSLNEKNSSRSNIDGKCIRFRMAISF